MIGIVRECAPKLSFLETPRSFLEVMKLLAVVRAAVGASVLGCAGLRFFTSFFKGMSGVFVLVFG